LLSGYQLEPDDAPYKPDEKGSPSSGSSVRLSANLRNLTPLVASKIA